MYPAIQCMFIHNTSFDFKVKNAKEALVIKKVFVLKEIRHNVYTS